MPKNDLSPDFAFATGGEPTTPNNAEMATPNNDAMTPTNAAMMTPNDTTAATINAAATPTPTRKYPRASFHDYNGGDYFVTCCTAESRHYFGNIADGAMHLSAIGKALYENFNDIGTHFDDVEIPVFVIMPNHFHAIIRIGGQPTVGSPPVATSKSPESKFSNLGRLNQLARLTVATGGDPTYTTHHANRLAVVVGSIKAAVTRFARRNNFEFAWQSRYYDHIIRDLYDENRIVDYIENNVARWDADRFYASRPI
ncbi:MAG: hypothetical protein NC418_03035 [Muribaculaceae bacterium]|nr:hypothetical protein [Muribaculaceae bacterium]